jgi:PAS domain S-box-containing protein
VIDPTPSEAATPLRLFLVEPDEDLALLIRKGLERAGHHVTTCRTAADALLVLGHGQFHLVLLEQALPDLSGLELFERLARAGIATPVLMVTGQGDADLAARVLRAGALDFVVKDSALTFLGELPKRVGAAVSRHQLQSLNRLLGAALASARDGVLITDREGTILHVNGALERLSGYAREELLGQTPRLFKSGTHGVEFYAGLWRTILAGASWQGELTNRRKDGSLFDASLTVSPIVDERGRLTHFVGICRDVSERKQLERQLLQAQKMQSVGTLAGGVAHEFNNLLAGIQGYAALGLREAGVSAPVREFLSLIVGLSDRAARLTRQLLAFARKPALRRQPTRLAELVRGTAELVARTLHQEVQLELAEDASGTEPLMVLADPNQLQQALVNLALNARDALAEPAPVVFRLGRRVLAEALPAFPDQVPVGEYLLLEVVDAGSGMTPEVLSQALDPFFTTKGVGQGTGLGLPTVYGIVQGHQGYLAIASAPGRGTCVGLYLPRLTSPTVAEPARKEPEAGRGPEPVGTPGRTILVVDDEEAVLDVLRRFLEIAGHRVYAAQNGRQALEILAGNRAIDLVILDVRMPREEENLTLERLRRHLPGVPVLLCTGLLQPDGVPPLPQEGAVGLLRKPFKMEELWRAVDQALSGNPKGEPGA